MTSDELKRLKEVCEKTTPGSWHITIDTNQHDAQFIAEARTAMPKLIEEVERLREALQLIFERWDDLGVNKDDDFGTVNEAKEEARKALGGGG